VLLLANRFYNSTAHPRNVARLAARLFDATRSVHGLGHLEREWLEYAAILHNVGNAVARRGHHRHSLYIVRNGDLAGFTDREQMIIANVARYHRRSAPKSSHENYMALAPRDRETVKKLSALIRVANALDRGHRGNVHSLAADVRGNRLELRILTHDDATLELRAARDQRDYVERHLGLRLDVDVATIVPRAI
jgi:exopolyphosphatase/guanosine-5'-triphosphate,3'-diphosphate pyrophosphatase